MRNREIGLAHCFGGKRITLFTLKSLSRELASSPKHRKSQKYFVVNKHQFIIHLYFLRDFSSPVRARVDGMHAKQTISVSRIRVKGEKKCLSSAVLLPCYPSPTKKSKKDTNNNKTKETLPNRENAPGPKFVIPLHPSFYSPGTPRFPKPPEKGTKALCLVTAGP